MCTGSKKLKHIKQVEATKAIMVVHNDEVFLNAPGSTGEGSLQRL